MKKKKEIQNCLEQDGECKESGHLIFEREKSKEEPCGGGSD